MLISHYFYFYSVSLKCFRAASSVSVLCHSFSNLFTITCSIIVLDIHMHFLHILIILLVILPLFVLLGWFVILQVFFITSLQYLVTLSLFVMLWILIRYLFFNASLLLVTLS